jgi:putative DNA primase/helicase
MTASNPLMLAALAYASRGWPVFPCNPRNKRPVVRAEVDAEGREVPDSGGVKRASTDPDVIRGWWTQFPSAMIALACGRAAGVFVLDLDVEDDADGEKLRALIAALEQKLGVKLPATWEVVTPRGGRHRYYQLPAGELIGNRAGLLGKDSHVDVRGEAGYVILPPSARGDDKRYAWVEGFAPSSKDALPAKAPPELLACILRSGNWAIEPAARATDETQRPHPRPSLRLVAADGCPVGGTSAAVHDAGDVAVERYAAAALAREIAEVEGAGRGERNNRTNTAALRLGEFVRFGTLTEAEVRAKLEAAAAANGLVDEDGIRAVRKTIESGLGAGKRKGKRDLAAKLTEVRREAEERARRREGGGTWSREKPPPDFADADRGSPTPKHETQERPRYAGSGGFRPPPDDPFQSSLHRQLAHFPMTDLGNAERFAARFKHLLLWCPEIGWLWWDGRRWSRDRVDEKVLDAEHFTVRAIQGEARRLRDSGADEKRGSRKGGKGEAAVDVMLSELLEGWGRASEESRRLAPISKRARAALAVAQSELDADPFKITVLNGTLVVHRRERDGGGDRIEFRAHDPGDRITRLMPVEYDPAALCPLYDCFLAEVQPGADVRRFLHQWGGLSLTGDVSEEKLVFFWGVGQNGKTTLIEIWAYIAGDYAESVPIESFVNEGRSRNAGQATPDLAMLRGARYAYTDEPEKGARLSESLIKLLTGGNTIKVRELRMPYFRMRPQFKLTMSGNFKPRITGGEAKHGIWRRMVMVDWSVTIPEDKRDFDLKEKLQAEASGILNRLLDGLRDWLDHRLVLPTEVKESTERYRSESDVLGRFLADCTVAGDPEKDRVQSHIMHELFVAWARANGEREWTNNGLGRAMHDRGCRSRHSNGSFWLGLKLIRRVDEFIDKDGKPLSAAAPVDKAGAPDDDIVPL